MPRSRGGPFGFEPWRKVMLGGGLLLLALAVLNAFLRGGLPEWLLFVGNFIGGGILAVGFVLAMRARHEPDRKKEEELP